MRHILPALAALAITLISSVGSASDPQQATRNTESKIQVYEKNHMPDRATIPHGTKVYLYRADTKALELNLDYDWLQEFQTTENWRYTIDYTLEETQELKSAKVVIEEKVPGRQEWNKRELTLGKGKSIQLPGQQAAIPVEDLLQKAIAETEVPYQVDSTRAALGEIIRDWVEDGECKTYKGNMLAGELIIENKGKFKWDNYSIRRIVKDGQEVYIVISGQKKKKPMILTPEQVEEAMRYIGIIRNPIVDDECE